MNDIPIETESQDVPYLLIHNDILADDRLSYKARGILAYILSRAGKWEVRFRDIVNHSQHDGPAAIRSGLTELVKFGYAALKPHYRPGKKPGTVELAGKRYVILKYVPIPKNTFPEVTVLRTSGNSNFENPHLRKTITITRSEEVRTNSKKEELNQEIKTEDYPPTPLPENSLQTADLFSQATNQPFGQEVANSGEVNRAHAPGGETSLPTPTNNSRPKPLEIVDLWNRVVPEHHPRVKKDNITPGRIDKIQKYLRIFPDMTWWEQTFLEIGQSLFLQGKKPTPGHENFVAEFDWFFVKGKHDGVENCQKVHEGKYRDQKDTPPRNEDARRAAASAWYAQFRQSEGK